MELTQVFRFHDWFLGTVELRERSGGGYILHVGNRDIEIENGKKVGSGMHLGEGISKDKIGEAESAWRRKNARGKG